MNKVQITKHFLWKDFNYDCEDATKLTDEAVTANVIEYVIFNGEFAYWMFRADSVADDTVLLQESQETDDNDEQNIDPIILEGSLTC